MGGLSGTVRPQESVHFTRRDVEVEAVQRAGGTEGLDEAFH